MRSSSGSFTLLLGWDTAAAFQAFMRTSIIAKERREGSKLKEWAEWRLWDGDEDEGEGKEMGKEGMHGRRQAYA